MTESELVDALDAALPQTQCTRCGFPDCRTYAEALAVRGAEINQCPPGGAEGVARLAALTGRPVLPLNPKHGEEGPLQLAVIDENWCIGCTLCIKACPVDAITGSAKHMHTVIEPLCTGCELCIPVCPVDCISLANVSGSLTGWDGWSPTQAAQGRVRYQQRTVRISRDEAERQARLATKRESLSLASLPVESVPSPSASASAPVETGSDSQQAAEAKRQRVLAAIERARIRQDVSAQRQAD